MAYVPPEGDELSFAFSDGAYAPPEGNLLAFAFLSRPPYVPPLGSKVGLEFGEAGYVPPIGSRVALEFVRSSGPPSENQFAFPVGWDSAEPGAPAFRNGREFLRPGGFATFGVGASLVWKFHTFVAPSGFNASAVGALVAQLKHRPVVAGGVNAGAAGNPTIINRNRHVAAGNIAAPAWGANPTIWLYTRYLLPTGLLATGTSSTNRVSHDRQYAQLNAGIPAPGFGTAWISHGTRVVSPTGVFLDAVARPSVGGTRFLTPPGWDSAVFGTRIIPESQTVAPLGFREAWGATAIKNHLAFVLPSGFETNTQEQFRWGRPELWNLRQLVVQNYDATDGLNPPPWSQWTLVENRSRMVFVLGVVPPRSGEPQIFNNARVVAPAGMVPPGYPGTAPVGMVAFGVRRLPLEGIESPPVLGWTAVHNAARVIRPAGESGQDFGTAMLENTRRYYSRFGDIDSASYGAAFIAFAIRSISMEPRYAIQPPDVPLPEVKLYTRYIEPKPDDMAAFGLPALSVHFNIVAPKWAHRDLIGEPLIFNVTPEVRAFGWNAEELGNAFVRLQWRPVSPDGSSMQLFGQARVADRTQRIAVPGNNLLRIGDKLVVTKTGAPPYSPQWIVQDDEPLPGSVFGKPGLNQYVLYAFGVAAPAFGNAEVRSNVLQVDAGIKVDGYGVPVLTLGRRTVEVGEWPLSQVFEPSPARVTPHTIWAVVEAPEQAKRNHSAGNLHYVGQTNQYGPGARFGNAWVSTYRGQLRPSTVGDTARIGVHRIYLHRRYVEPPGLQAYRVGSVNVGDGRQFVAQFAASDALRIGTASVARGAYTGPQTVRPGGLNALSFGLTWASLLHRTLPIAGFHSLAMGSSRGEGPYQWQSLHVGPPMPTIPRGFEPLVFGAAWISLRVRGAEPPGFDAFACEYDLEHFHERMRVRNAYVPPGPPPRAVVPVGIDLPALGVPNAWPAVHYIRPDGNADQYRKGAF